MKSNTQWILLVLNCISLYLAISVHHLFCSSLSIYQSNQLYHKQLNRSLRSKMQEVARECNIFCSWHKVADEGVDVNMASSCLAFLFRQHIAAFKSGQSRGADLNARNAFVPWRTRVHYARLRASCTFCYIWWFFLIKE